MHPYRPDILDDPKMRAVMEAVARAFVAQEPYISMQIIGDASKLPVRLDSTAALYVTVNATLGATPAFGSGAGLYRNTGSGWTFIG